MFFSYLGSDRKPSGSILVCIYIGISPTDPHVSVNGWNSIEISITFQHRHKNVKSLLQLISLDRRKERDDAVNQSVVSYSVLCTHSICSGSDRYLCEQRLGNKKDHKTIVRICPRQI